MLRVEIDPNSGFCPGVIRVVDKAQEKLDRNGHLYSYGSIVHNEEELSRLESMGLRSVDSLDQANLPQGEPILVRAHGVPPSFYEQARQKGLDVIDCTCPVVLNLQKEISQAYSRIKSKGGQIVIFGKIGHAEVLGLVGQTQNNALVVETMEQLEDALSNNRISGPVELFSQTTMSPEGYKEVSSFLKERVGDIVIHESICSRVSSRHSILEKFAKTHDVVVFVAGSTSSNGKVLLNLCKSFNSRTYHVVGVSQIDSKWFGKDDFVGVCGATSTPKWLLEQVAGKIENLQ